MIRREIGIIEVVAFILMLVIALFTGCSTKTAIANDGSSYRLWGYSGRTVKWVCNDNPNINFFLLVDQETGVQYICATAESGVSVTPLLNYNGTPCRVVE